jgi:chromosome segregation protein
VTMQENNISAVTGIDLSSIQDGDGDEEVPADD